MKLTADYHIHSTYSKNNHGKSTIAEIAEKSIELGLKEIAVTDHGPKHFLYGIERENIKKARFEVDELSLKYPQIKIKLGVESNILDYEGNIDIDDDIRDYFDIILCGYHIGVIFTGLKDLWNFTVMNSIDGFSRRLRAIQMEKNTQAVVNALNRNKIDILTHPGDKIPVYIDKVALAAEKNNTVLEINNHHNHLNAEEIRIAAKYRVKFSIGSDAHIKDNIGGFENSLRAAQEAGLDLSRIINLS